MRKNALLLGLLVTGLGAILVLSPAPAQATCFGGAPDGNLQTGEECDFGSNPSDCCSDDCTLLPVGTVCDDFDVCSINTTCDSEGQCSGSPDPAHPNNSACDDHNECTRNDQCNANGHCVGGAGNNGQACHQLGPQGERLNCKTLTCNQKACSGAVISDPCDDGNACTTDTCINPNGSTAADMCDPNHPPIPVGQACDTDGTACTQETCHDDDHDGVTTCQLDNTITCTDSNLLDCKYPDCNPTTGACDVIKKKVKGTPCGDDGNICTEDQCSGTGTCTHPAVTIPTACNDNNSCTGPDMCSGKTCVGPVLSNGTACSDDGNICTVDYCSSGTCSHAGTNPFTLATTDGTTCDDHNVCTSASTCAGGTCTGQTCATGTCAGACGSTACSTTLPNCGCSGS